MAHKMDLVPQVYFSCLFYILFPSRIKLDMHTISMRFLTVQCMMSVVYEPYCTGSIVKCKSLVSGGTPNPKAYLDLALCSAYHISLCTQMRNLPKMSTRGNRIQVFREIDRGTGGRWSEKREKMMKSLSLGF